MIIQSMEKKKSGLSTEEKRIKIGECVLVLKKGLKRLRREDVDVAIALLIQYDQDLKFAGKKAIESLSTIVKVVNKGKDEAMAIKPGTKIEKDQIKAVIINDAHRSVAYPYDDEEMYEYIPAIERGEIKPIGNVFIESWMKAKSANEVSFTSTYATIALGHIEKVLEPVVKIGEQVRYKGISYKVLSMTKNFVHIDRGWFMSKFSVDINECIPVTPSEVQHFRIDSWQQ